MFLLTYILTLDKPLPLTEIAELPELLRKLRKTPLITILCRYNSIKATHSSTSGWCREPTNTNNSKISPWHLRMVQLKALGRLAQPIGTLAGSDICDGFKISGHLWDNFFILKYSKQNVLKKILTDNQSETSVRILWKYRKCQKCLMFLQGVVGNIIMSCVILVFVRLIIVDNSQCTLDA